MNKIVCFDNYVNNSVKTDFVITIDDILKLFLIFKHKEGILTEFDVSVLMQSLAKYRSLEKFNSIFKDILTERNEYDIEIINLRQVLEKFQQEKLIIISPDNKDNVYILGSEENFEILRSNYDAKILDSFNNLMFYINNDLNFGIGNWQIFTEDEIIDVPRHPNFATGEFINQDKRNSLVKKKMKKRAIENTKNIYE